VYRGHLGWQNFGEFPPACAIDTGLATGVGYALTAMPLVAKTTPVVRLSAALANSTAAPEFAPAFL
jgi:hypothetical protein